MKYVQVAIDNKNDSTDMLYTYGCEFDDIEVGNKVYVPFNRGNKIKQAYVFAVDDICEQNFKNLKYVDSIDNEIKLSEEAIETITYMRKRYFCRYIDVIKLFLPAGSKAKRREKKEPADSFEGERQDIKVLTDEQQNALAQIVDSIKKSSKDTFLLRGITGSGKTEIYMRSISCCIECGKTAIMMVPEVSLTNQIIDRFIDRFGRKNIAILHSKLSNGERYDQWQKIRSGEIRVVIGTRSAVFAPVENIGLMILDEEHETTYKSDMTPKYSTHDVAKRRASFYGGSVILGSATPSIESMHYAKQGDYKELVLRERYNKTPLPKVVLADMRKELKGGNRSVFSRTLYDETKKILADGKQAIFLINRRGYSSFISCRSCGEVIKCDNCDIPMTYHKAQTGEKALVCHYCGRKKDLPTVCPVCGSKYIKHFGVGTQQIQKEAQKIFKGAIVGRLDFDTAKKNSEVNKILKAFATGKTDILVGTQLVAKGLDYKNVGLVGILAIDTMLNLPDYRAYERTFQLVAQAAGRAGRGDEQGKVVVQTYEPENFALVCGASQDPQMFYDKEIRLRNLMKYPPFGFFAQISILGSDPAKIKKIEELCAHQIKKEVLQSENTLVGTRKYAKETNELRVIMLYKLPENLKGSFVAVASNLKEYMRENKTGCSLIIDINPYTLWRN